jgi:hypothetical protein
MNDAQRNHASAPASSLRGSWTSRIVLWTLAGVIGLWLGTGVRPVAAGRQAKKSSAITQSAIADVFRFDILLAGKESKAKAERPKTPSVQKYILPQEVAMAVSKRPEPISSPMPKTLLCTRPRFGIAPPARPAGQWRIKIEASTAGLAQTQAHVKALLATVPDLTDANLSSFRIEVDKACTQSTTPRVEQWNDMREAPQPPDGFTFADFSDAWQQRSMRLMP